MSKAKNVSLCLPVMVVMGGKSYPAGTPVPMDAATAKEMRARYREVPESRAEKQPKRPVKPTGEALTKAIYATRLRRGELIGESLNKPRRLVHRNDHRRGVGRAWRLGHADVGGGL